MEVSTEEIGSSTIGSTTEMALRRRSGEDKERMHVERATAELLVVTKAVELHGGDESACGWWRENVDCGEEEGREKEKLWR